LASVQLTEHEPVQVTWQVEPPAQEMLPLAPRVTSQVDPPPQPMLHDSPQVPEQLLWSAQLSEQLPVGPQLDCVNPQLICAGHMQLAPEQVRLLLASPPQADATNMTSHRNSCVFRMMIPTGKRTASVKASLKIRMPHGAR
jgi:hypothetical protein